MIVPVILSGGAGTRLWPLSQPSFPKQFLNLLDPHQSMFQMTLRRVDGIKDIIPPIIICNAEHHALVTQHLKAIDIDDAHILCEPAGRNTAPAIVAAAYYAIKLYPHDNPKLLILSADHMMGDIPRFQETIHQAVKTVDAGYLTIFGITPTEPNTNYGYIQLGEKLAADAPGFRVSSFKEKPNLETAKNYLKSRDYLWNAGIFFWAARDILSALKTHAPDVLTPVIAAVNHAREIPGGFLLNADDFGAAPKISIDHAVLEKMGAGKNHELAVVPLDCPWSDIGSFAALWAALPHDQNGNAIMGKGDVQLENVTDCLIYTDDYRVVAKDVNKNIIITKSDIIFYGGLKK